MVDGEVRLDRRILAAVTRRGRRLLTHAELVEEGASNRQIEVRCRRGTLQRVHDEVYLVGAGSLTWREQVLAGVQAGGATGAGTSYSALRLWGLSDYAPRSVHVRVSHDTTLRARGVQVHRSRRDVPTAVIDGIRVVCLEEALLELAGRVSRREVHRQLTTAWRMRKTTPRKVLLHLERHGGKGVRGVKKLGEIAALYDGSSRGPGSEAEADFVFDFRAALDGAGIESPELQHAISIRGGSEKVVPDFTWPARRKAIEMKGLSAHGDYLIQDEDNEREAAIRAAGWDLEIVTPRSMRERPGPTIERLLRFLGAPDDRNGRPTRPER